MHVEHRHIRSSSGIPEKSVSDIWITLNNWSKPSLSRITDERFLLCQTRDSVTKLAFQDHHKAYFQIKILHFA